MTVAGVNINPVAFLIIQANNVKLLPVDHASSIDKLLDYIPDMIEKANNLMNKAMQNKKEEKNKIRQEEIRQKREEEKKEEKKEEEKIIQKTRPKRAREPKNVSYEIEYGETEDSSVPDEIIYEDYDQYDE